MTINVMHILKFVLSHRITVILYWSTVFAYSARCWGHNHWEVSVGEEGEDHHYWTEGDPHCRELSDVHPSSTAPHGSNRRRKCCVSQLPHALCMLCVMQSLSNAFSYRNVKDFHYLGNIIVEGITFTFCRYETVVLLIKFVKHLHLCNTL